MRRGWGLVIGLCAAALSAGLAYGGSDPAATAPASGAPSQGELPLVLTIRSLSYGPTPLTESGDMERVRPSNGAGTSRWPSATTPIARGVYISVTPVCVPGVDEPLWPAPVRARRR